MNKKLKVAVLDNGINLKNLLDNTEESIEIKNDNSIVVIDKFQKDNHFHHGEYCYLIIKKYSNQCSINSVCILDENGKGVAKKLEPALKWCIENDVRVINLSLGTIHFKDKNIIRQVINFYANKGLIIVAASSNSGYTTYPASFSNVIGVSTSKVCNDNEKYIIANDIHKGLDFLSLSTHKINYQGFNVISEMSNSYATPFITAQIINLIYKYGQRNVFELRNILKNELLKTVKKYKCFAPDWIYQAYICDGRTESLASYYFISYYDFRYNDIEQKVDTIVVYNIDQLQLFKNTNKKLIYLGEQVIESFSNIVLWQKNDKVKEINLCRFYEKELDIPIIIVHLHYKLDKYYILQKLQKFFYDDDYNVYAVSFNPECILFDLNYIPQEFLDLNKINKIKDFLYGESYYKKCDAIILEICDDVYSKEIIEFFNPEIIIDFECELNNVKLLAENKICYEYKYNLINADFLKAIYDRLTKLLL